MKREAENYYETVMNAYIRYQSGPHSQSRRETLSYAHKNQREHAPLMVVNRITIRIYNLR